MDDANAVPANDLRTLLLAAADDSWWEAPWSDPAAPVATLLVRRPAAGECSDSARPMSSAPSAPSASERPGPCTDAEAGAGPLLLQAALAIRGSLHPLLVGSQALLRCGEVAPAARALIGQQLRAVAESSRLLDALIHLAQLESGSRSPADTSFDLGAEVGHAARALSTVAQSRSAGLRSEVGSAWVRGDPVLLRDVLGLLVGELLRAATGGGVVLEARIGQTEVALDLCVSGDLVGATVSGDRHRAPDGSPEASIGLVLACRLAARLGCTPDLRRAVGALVGARVVLRRAAAVSPVASAGVQPSRPRRGLNILVVDEDAAVRLATRLLLEAEGLDVTLASCSEDARACARADPPDVAVVDLRLGPGDSGTDALESIRRSVGWPVPAILLARDGTERVTGRDVEVLQKPFAAEDLLDAIARASNATWSGQSADVPSGAT